MTEESDDWLVGIRCAIRGAERMEADVSEPLNTIDRLLRSEVRVVNIGLAGFADELRRCGVISTCRSSSRTAPWWAACCC